METGWRFYVLWIAVVLLANMGAYSLGLALRRLVTRGRKGSASR
jgi:hypothetical protein